MTGPDGTPGLLPVTEAQARLLALASPLLSDLTSFSECVGRYISHDVPAVRNQPSTPLSAMDGFAIRFADLPGPWTIIGAIPAGTVPAHSLRAGETMRIFTGAPLPEGADSVLIQEDGAISGSILTLTGRGPATPGAFVRAAASDFATGTPLLTAGSRVTPGAIAAAIMGGAAQLPVGGRPRVAILTTGDELVAPGRPLTAGQIPDSNGAMLSALLASEPAQVTLPLHARDDRRILSNIFEDLVRHHDVIVAVGGASVGDHDHLCGAFQDAGGSIDFWKIAMRPGKPLMAGTIGDAVLLGLPGNPSSAFVTAILFLLPLVRHLAGSGRPLPVIRQAPFGTPLAAGNDRRDYLRARLIDGRLFPFDGQDSGRTLPLATADALVIRDIDAPPSAIGALADYIAVT